MKKTITVICGIAFAIIAFAIPAKRGLQKIFTTEEGKQIKLELRGDEFIHFWEDSIGNKYEINQEGKAQLIKNYKKKSEIAAKNRLKINRTRAKRRIPLGGKHNKYEGTKKGLVILTQFQDQKFDKNNTVELFKDILNKRNYANGQFKGSVKDYFLAQSNGAFELDFDVVGPVTLPKNVAYYGQDNKDDIDLHSGEMVAEACKLANKYVDFNDYDWDGDGFVDQVYVLYAGKGQADGGEEHTIWPHEYELVWSDYGQRLDLDNVYINTYACGPELNGHGKIQGIGTICHEFSHCLGLPDMYDTKNTSNPCYGMDSWDIMDYGSYNGNGYVPANYTSYERIYAGWLKPTILKKDTIVTNMKSLSDNGEAFIIHNERNQDEYYLLENRQSIKWDEYIANSGLLILHVDYDKIAWNSNEVNTDKNHQRCTIFHADDKIGTSYKNVYNDIYPYCVGEKIINDSLTNTSSPKASLFHKNTDGSKLMNISITKIRKQKDGTVSFQFKTNADKSEEEEENDNYFFYESFNKCKGTGGNDGLWSGSIAYQTFIPDNEGWEMLTDNAKSYGAYECAKFGTSKSEGTVITPSIKIDKPAEITFKAAPWKQERTSILILPNEESNIKFQPESFQLQPNQWTDCKAKITGVGTFKILFQPTTNKRFFLDEIKIMPMIDTGIEVIKVDTTIKDNRIYSIDGRYMGKDFNLIPKGIYIINGKKIAK